MAMYQVPIDMSTRMMSVPLETKSPSFHTASRPYGFSTVTFSGETSWPAPAGGVGAFAGASAGAAGAGWPAGAEGCAWAKAADATSSGAAGRAMSAMTSITGRRLRTLIVRLLEKATLELEKGGPASVLETEIDLVFADEAHRLGIELPLRQGADHFAIEDPVARLADLHLR